MYWRNEAGWQTWEDRIIQGEVYSFMHLRPFDMPVVRPAKGEWPEFTSTVRVVFDCHVVTKKCAEFYAEDPRYWLDIGGNYRCFEPKRYRYSRILPGMIAGLANGQTKCYIGKHNNYMVWQPASGEDSQQSHYQAYFDFYRPHNQAAGTNFLILYVQSAYLKDEPFVAQRERFKAFGQMCAELCGVIQPKPKGPKNKAKKKK
jgi:hypothetical protein